MAMQAITEHAKQNRAERTPLPRSILLKPRGHREEGGGGGGGRRRGAPVLPTLMESASLECSDLMAANMLPKDS